MLWDCTDRVGDLDDVVEPDDVEDEQDAEQAVEDVVHGDHLDQLQGLSVGCYKIWKVC